MVSLGEPEAPVAWSLVFVGLWGYLCRDTPSGQRGSLATATFAGGCFWCMEQPFDDLEGVVSTTAGYTGGNKVAPTYKEVSAGRTGHTEAVQVAYDPKKISHDKLLEVFWRNVDPTTPDRQFCGVGSQYRTGIFCHNEGQKELAQRLKSALTHSKPFEDPIVTEITAASEFSWQRVIIRITI